MNSARVIRRTLLAFGVLFVVVYGGFVTWFLIHEQHLLYAPEKSLEATPDMFGMVYGAVVIPSTDSVRLAGWVIPSADTSTLWVLYLHGNAGNMARRGYVEHYAQLHRLSFNILTVDYRGFGESSGQPEESGLLADARASYDYLRGMMHVPPSRIVIYGYSLGSAIAVHLAGQVAVAGLIVEGSFPSITEVGAERYPYLPVRLLARGRFAAREMIASVTVPKLFIHARDDQTVPLHFGRELFEAAPEPKTFLEVNGGHENAHDVDSRLFYGGIQMFVMQIQHPQEGDAVMSR